jgi:hypothetical protein
LKYTGLACHPSKEVFASGLSEDFFGVCLASFLFAYPKRPSPLLKLSIKRVAHHARCISPMKFDLESFKSIYRDEFDEDLSDEEAERNTRRILNLYIALYSNPADIAGEMSLTEK